MCILMNKCFNFCELMKNSLPLIPIFQVWRYNVDVLDVCTVIGKLLLNTCFHISGKLSWREEGYSLISTSYCLIMKFNRTSLSMTVTCGK